MIRRYLPKSTEELIGWYERYISPVSLLVGFTVDAVAVAALDVWLYSFVLLFHLSLATIGIMLMQMIEAGRLRGCLFIAAAPFIPVVMQFAFGGLFSGFLLLYSTSAAVSVSWIFVVLLAVLLVGNERFRKLYVTFPTQAGILFFALFSFAIFFIPLLTKTVGPWMFVVSGAVSVGLMVAYLSVCSLLVPSRIKEYRGPLARILSSMFLLINVLYFVGAVPPLPLALRDAGVFHSIEREGNSYAVTYEPRRWYEPYLRYNQTFHRLKGETVFVYTAVFVPTGISTNILHEWQRYDDIQEKWMTESTFGFPVQGGRDGGYRGYTLKGDVEAGTWRVNVRTDYGQLIGRVAFTVEEVDSSVVLESGER